MDNSDFMPLENKIRIINERLYQKESFQISILKNRIKKRRKNFETIIELFIKGFSENRLRRASDIACCEFCFCTASLAINDDYLDTKALEVQKIYPQYPPNLYSRIKTISSFIEKLKVYDDRQKIKQGNEYYYALYFHSKKIHNFLQSNAKVIRGNSLEIFNEVRKNRENAENYEVFSYLLQMYALLKFYTPEQLIRVYKIDKWE